MPNNKFVLGASAALFIASAGAAFSAAHTMAPTLAVSAQPASTSVTIDTAVLKDGGFVVIHEIVDGKPVVPASIGHAKLKPGKNKNIVVKLIKKPKPGSKLLAMLHNDDGIKGLYQFGKITTKFDKPVIVDGKPVVKPFPVK